MCPAILFIGGHGQDFCGLGDVVARHIGLLLELIWRSLMDGVRNPCEQFVLLGDWIEWRSVFRNTTWRGFGIDSLHKQFPIRFVLIGDPNEWCSVFCNTSWCVAIWRGLGVDNLHCQKWVSEPRQVVGIDRPCAEACATAARWKKVRQRHARHRCACCHAFIRHAGSWRAGGAHRKMISTEGLLNPSGILSSLQTILWIP